MSKKYFIVILCVLSISTVHLKICRDVQVTNIVTDFEVQLRNCSIISGYLKLVLIDNASVVDYDDISFPELIEVQGYLLVYRIAGLTSLGRLFPNLSVIRGLKLFMDYSFVVYEMLHLQEIGLSNLKFIGRGSIRIDKCPRLCYVETVNWSRILSPAHNLHYFNTNDGVCKKCPSRCNGFCWNQNYCQVKESNKCHSECVGCSGPGPDQCHVCRFYKDGKRCVSECPKNKVRHSVLSLCVTPKECLKILPGTWWIFQGECRKSCPSGYKRVPKEQNWCEYCGDRCPKICNAAQVDSIASAELLRGCIRIEGELTIRVNSKATADELEENLGMIEEIDSYLKIYRSSSLTTFEFLKNLKVIRGRELYNNRYALVVYENPSLHTLWNWNNFKTKIENGTLMFHYNSQLCMSEIEKLKNLTNLNASDIDVSPHSNGNKKACNYINLNVTINANSESVKLIWRNVTLNSNASIFIGYLVYYAEDPYMNMSVYNERDECENNWNIILVSNNSIEIKNLNAHAQYAYYIKTYVTLPSLAAQTIIDYFETLSDDPSNPTNVETSSNSSDSITLIWSPPEFPNGILSYYVLDIYFEADDPAFIKRRNYCDYPHHIHNEEVTKIPTEIWSNTTDNSTCNCQRETKISSKTFDSRCDDFDIILKPNLRSTGCKRFTYSVDENSKANNFNDNVSIVLVEGKRHNLIKRSYLSTNNITEISTEGPTSFEIKQLKPFSMYIILLTACINMSKCSGHEMVFQRTLNKEGADDIPPGLSVNVDSYDVIIEWSEPENPNALIVAYHVEHKRIDLENSKAISECLTQAQYVHSHSKYRMRNFLPGQYSVRVKAISLAGPGKFTDVIEFEITVPSHGTLTAFIIVLIIVLILTPACLFCYHHYKRKNSIDQLRLISTINSSGTGSDYVEDEWEIDRGDVEIFKELGQGTFGMVYNGLIKSQDRPCAVKAISDQANIRERIDFLNEASTMKLFSEAHHVVKLLGVVSRGQPPLVVMELMARGDLKSFLRQSRSSSSSNVTCAEMYRMAAEIADGMMYLAVKKFVHRDLAARNCMVSADHTVKIGDFGMTRDIYETDYYRKEAGGLMPIRWMSPESLADGVFTNDSDVWSYGVVLWEIVTLAEQPYQGLANEQVLQFVTAQGTLERPLECPDLLYEIMEASWKWRPNQRPLFKDIVEKLEPHIGQHFRLVSFYHSCEGEEYRMNPRDRVYNHPALSMPFSKNTAVYWDAMQDDFSL